MLLQARAGDGGYGAGRMSVWWWCGREGTAAAAYLAAHGAAVRLAMLNLSSRCRQTYQVWSSGCVR